MTFWAMPVKESEKLNDEQLRRSFSYPPWIANRLQFRPITFGFFGIHYYLAYKLAKIFDLHLLECYPITESE